MLPDMEAVVNRQAIGPDVEAPLLSATRRTRRPSTRSVTRLHHVVVISGDDDPAAVELAAALRSRLEFAMRMLDRVTIRSDPAGL